MEIDKVTWKDFGAETANRLECRVGRTVLPPIHSSRSRHVPRSFLSTQSFDFRRGIAWHTQIEKDKATGLSEDVLDI